MTRSDPNSEAAIRDGFARQPFMATIGARVDRVAPGEVDLGLDFEDRLTQGDGFLHAGVVSTLLDNACGWAAFTLAPPDTFPLTTEFKINLLRPAVGDKLTARAQVLKPGRLITVCRADAVMTRGGAETLAATMLATIILQPRPDA
jgi:uncharacterized protein (TIGR00369 family)